MRGSAKTKPLTKSLLLLLLVRSCLPSSWGINLHLGMLKGVSCDIPFLNFSSLTVFAFLFLKDGCGSLIKEGRTQFSVGHHIPCQSILLYERFTCCSSLQTVPAAKSIFHICHCYEIRQNILVEIKCCLCVFEFLVELWSFFLQKYMDMREIKCISLAPWLLRNRRMLVHNSCFIPR